MNKGKRWIKQTAVCGLALLLAAFAPPLPAGRAAAQESMTIVATIFPGYDFARVIAGDRAQVSMLLPPGGDSHSYEPTPQDMIAIQNAGLFIYVGGESDAWIDRILDSLGDSAPEAFRMMDCVTGLAEEVVGSMEAEDEGAAHEAEMDEHVWTSPKNAKLIVAALEKKLVALDPSGTEIFAAHAAAYQQELEALDAAFEQVVQSGKRRLMVFGDRFPFRYFAAAYGLAYDAAFPGCSEDSEPSVKTVMALTDVIRQQSIPVVFYIEFSSRKTADILAEETGARELLFHSCHTVSAEELQNGASYLSLMRGNVEALREALN